MTIRRDLVMFADQPCAPCMGTGTSLTKNIFGGLRRCDRCKGTASANHVQLPGGRWMPVIEWRKTERGECFFRTLMKGRVLTWDELLGGSAYKLVAEAENDLEGIKIDVAAVKAA